MTTRASAAYPSRWTRVDPEPAFCAPLPGKILVVPMEKHADFRKVRRLKSFPLGIDYPDQAAAFSCLYGRMTTDIRFLPSAAEAVRTPPIMAPVTPSVHTS